MLMYKPGFVHNKASSPVVANISSFDIDGTIFGTGISNCTEVTC